MDDLEKIENTQVVSVWSVFVSTIKKEYVISVIVPVLFLILAGELTFLTKAPNFLFYYILLLFILYGFLWQKVIGDFLKHFSSDIGYNYEETGDVSSIDGTIFNFGNNRNISKVVSGKYFGKNTRLFIFSTVIGSGKSKRVERYSAMEITFDTMLPNILLKNKATWLSSPELYLDNEKKLVLEGDFSKYFSLYVVKEYEVEALQIFTPDIMQMFLEKAGNISLEIYKDKVYLYYPKEITKKEQLVAVYSLAKDIILKLDPVFSVMKKDVEDMSKYAKLT